MSIVKTTKKSELEELVAKLTLRLGKKPAQQEVLDLCVILGSENFEEIAQRLSPTPILDDSKYQRILEMMEEMKKGEWTPVEEIEWGNEVDRLAYGED
ncbi:MAG: hypothetical protein EU530_06655 [Promethearchaeota archaeon]|nr:MAG: hypothetical protein EU530_06655 [Candidatus Lokiarchaeota archaeon]